MNITVGTHVLEALREGKPLVALEAALMTDGLASLVNLEIVQAMETAVKSSGAIPGTIGILDGRVIIGLTETELEMLAGVQHLRKFGVQELPVAIAQKRSGYTSMAATAYLAHRFGFRVMGTGDINSYYSSASDDPAIANDFGILGRTPLTIISSGANAIYDLSLTLKLLDNVGLTVVGYRTDIFPAFYSASSPYRISVQLESVQEVTKVALARDELGLQAAILVCNPVPTAFAIPWGELIKYIEQVAVETRQEEIVGQDITPRMLQRLFTLTKGRTLKANQALLVENARLGGEIACAITKERKR